MMNGDYTFIVNLIAGLCLVLAQSIYIFQVVKKQITPSLYTWMGWSILVGVSFASQVLEYGWNWTLVGHLFSGIGCTAIFVFALLSGNFVVRSKDWIYLFLGAVCIVIYWLSSDPWSTTIFAILADAILGIPTILKAIKFPKTEKSVGWNISLACWSLTLITCWNNNVLFVLFPAYCFVFNGLITYLTTNKRITTLAN